MMRRLLSICVFGAAAMAPAPAFSQDSGRVATAPAGITRVIPLERLVAIVGKHPITLTELYENVNDENARRMQRGMSQVHGADTLPFMRRILDNMVDAQLLIMKSDEFKFPIKDDEITKTVDDQMKQIRADYKSEQEFRDSLRVAGISSPEELRRKFIEQEKQHRLQKMTVDTLTRLGQMPTISVSERDIQQAFDSLKTQMGPRGPTVTFRQIVMKPKWTDASDARAKQLADSLLTVLKAGGNFDSLAVKFSDDTASARLGGDLGWFRHGAMTEQFDRMVFSLQLGALSPLVKTEFGYHIIRVDRLRPPGEVRARHILIMPKKDTTDLARTKGVLAKLADTLRHGASFDSIADLYHDGILHRRKVDNKPLEELPAEYVTALAGLKVGEYSPVFDVVMPNGELSKAGTLQLISRNESGEWTLAETRERIRSDLQKAGSWRRLLDNLRKQTYVSIRLDPVPAPRIAQ